MKTHLKDMTKKQLVAKAKKVWSTRQKTVGQGDTETAERLTDFHNRLMRRASRLKEESLDEVSKKAKTAAYILRYSREAKGEKSPGVWDSASTLRMLITKHGVKAMKGAIRRGNVVTNSRGFSRGKYAKNDGAVVESLNDQTDIAVQKVSPETRKKIMDLRARRHALMKHRATKQKITKPKNMINLPDPDHDWRAGHQNEDIKLAGNVLRKKLSKQYDKNEDENRHSENAVLLAKHFGTPEELERMQHMLKTRDKIGHLHSDHVGWAAEMSKKYYHKLKESNESSKFVNPAHVTVSSDKYMVTGINKDKGIDATAPVNIEVRGEYVHHYTTRYNAYRHNARPEYSTKQATELAQKDAYEHVKNRYGQEAHDKLKQWHSDNVSGKNDHLYHKESTDSFFDDVRPGDLVHYLTSHGQPGKGKVVMNQGTHLVLNTGGKHGTPQVVTPKNFVKHVSGGKVRSALLSNVAKSLRKEALDKVYEGIRSPTDDEYAVAKKFMKSKKNASNLYLDGLGVHKKTGNIHVSIITKDGSGGGSRHVLSPDGKELNEDSRDVEAAAQRVAITARQKMLKIRRKKKKRVSESVNKDDHYVILHRMPHKPDTKFGPESKSRASKRADALAYLHSSKQDFGELENTFHVYANDYYRPITKNKTKNESLNEGGIKWLSKSTPGERAAIRDRLRAGKEVFPHEMAKITIKKTKRTVKESFVNEVSAPGQEDWIVSNKQRFIDQYGKKKGLRILYAKAWKMTKEGVARADSERSQASKRLEKAKKLLIKRVHKMNIGDSNKRHSWDISSSKAGHTLTHYSGNRVVSKKYFRESTDTLPPIHQIARGITKNWKKMYFGAVPYVQAMHSLETAHDNYGMDSGHSVVAYGLSNMSSYSGKSVHDPELAKLHRAQLKAHLKAPKPIKEASEAKVKKTAERAIQLAKAKKKGQTANVKPELTVPVGNATSSTLEGNHSETGDGVANHA